MNKTLSHPKIAIIGRTNVGKSTLFNRLTKEKKSIVFEREAVTRDYIHEVISWQKKSFDLIDTGGLPLKKETDPILKEVQQSVHDIIQQADLILFVCDAKNGLIEEDRTLAKILHKTKKPVFLLLNKADNKTAYEENAYEFNSLGFKDIYPISAIHGTGIEKLLNNISETVETKKDFPQKPSYHITILGKPNVGKSSLMNLLIKEKRAIVSSTAGTTREAISEDVYFHKDLIQFIDTAGIRKKSKIEDPLEISMAKSSLLAIRNSDIVLLVIDSTKGQVSDQELKLLFYAFKEKKSIILVLNKTDILDTQHKEMLLYDLEKYNFFIKKLPVVWISCISKKNIGTILKEIQFAWKRRKQIFDKVKVENLIKEQLIKKPMYHKTLLLKVLRIQLIQGSIPTFILRVNYPQWFGPTQLGFIENVLRRNYDLLGCPIQLIPQKT